MHRVRFRKRVASGTRRIYLSWRRRNTHTGVSSKKLQPAASERFSRVSRKRNCVRSRYGRVARKDTSAPDDASVHGDDLESHVTRPSPASACVCVFRANARYLLLSFEREREGRDPRAFYYARCFVSDVSYTPSKVR